MFLRKKPHADTTFLFSEWSVFKVNLIETAACCLFPDLSIEDANYTRFESFYNLKIKEIVKISLCANPRKTRPAADSRSRIVSMF